MKYKSFNESILLKKKTIEGDFFSEEEKIWKFSGDLEQIVLFI